MKIEQLKIEQRISAVAQRAQANHQAKQQPDFKWDWDKEDVEIKEISAELEAINKAAGRGLAIGKVLTFGVADGNASYIVTKVRANDVIVEWIPMGDDYFAPAVGLTRDKRHWVVLRSTAETYANFDSVMA